MQNEIDGFRLFEELLLLLGLSAARRSLPV
jgi:hypothetical protein